MCTIFKTSLVVLLLKVATIKIRLNVMKVSNNFKMFGYYLFFSKHHNSVSFSSLYTFFPFWLKWRENCLTSMALHFTLNWEADHTIALIDKPMCVLKSWYAFMYSHRKKHSFWRNQHVKLHQEEDIKKSFHRWKKSTCISKPCTRSRVFAVSL